MRVHELAKELNITSKDLIEKANEALGLSLKSHDASQRANGFLTFFGGVIIAFAKDILDMIM